MKASMLIGVLQQAVRVAGDLDVALTGAFAISPSGEAFEVTFRQPIVGLLQTEDGMCLLLGTDDEGSGLGNLGTFVRLGGSEDPPS